MKDLFNKIVRPGSSFADNLIIASLLSLVVIIIGANISAIVFALTGLNGVLVNWLHSENLAIFLGDYLLTFGIWIAVLLFVLIPRKNRPMLRAWGRNRSGNTWKGIVAGLLMGFGANGICVLISVLAGDIKLSFFGFDPLILIAFLIAVFIQSASEELTDRLYLYQKLRRRYRSPLVAIIGNSLVFMALHVFNPGFTVIAGCQIFLVGIIFSLLVYYYDSLWAAMWFHTAWNYTQNIIFGLPNSGIVSEYSIFKLEAASATNGPFYNVNFGVEGSIGASLVLLIMIIVIIYLNRGKPEKNDLWAEA